MARVDLFTFIHKAIRTMLYETGKQLQTADVTDAAELDAVAGAIRSTLRLLDDHAEHEDSDIFPDFKRFDTATIEELEGQHVALHAKEDAVLAALDTVYNTQGDEAKLAAGDELLRAYNEMSAYCLMHMSHEERTALPISIENLTDEQLHGIHAKIESKIPPEVMGQWMRWIIPSMNFHDMRTVLTAIISNAPPAVVDNIGMIATETLGSERWTTIRQRIGV
ncbi:MAG: hypothetical protein CL946_05925 [Ectothiorhodospiraceae bacterium]|nr:hypothetical protein [Ectothiorhodospiraceae bacterium]